jgi:hypothetical protein
MAFPFGAPPEAFQSDNALVALVARRAVVRSEGQSRAAGPQRSVKTNVSKVTKVGRGNTNAASGTTNVVSKNKSEWNVVNRATNVNVNRSSINVQTSVNAQPANYRRRPDGAILPAGDDRLGHRSD